MAGAGPRTELAHWVHRYFELAVEPDLRPFHPDIVRAAACGRLGRHAWFLRHVMRLGEFRNARVLEVGCGGGWQAIAFSFLGGNTVCANDIRERMTSTIEERVAALNDEGAGIRVDAIAGDICTLGLEAGSFDGVFSNQAIEHVRDLDAMFAECARLLCPGGRCVVVDDNNVFNRKQAAENQAMWEDRDGSWQYVRRLVSRRPEEYGGSRPYAVMREDIVRAARPGLDSKTVDILASATAGLARDEIERVVRDYEPGGALPVPPALSWCRDPETGEYCERLLDPFEVMRTMESCGFQVRLHHSFRRYPLCLLNDSRSALLSRWLFEVRPQFVLVGEKI